MFSLRYEYSSKIADAGITRYPYIILNKNCEFSFSDYIHELTHVFVDSIRSEKAKITRHGSYMTSFSAPAGDLALILKNIMIAL
jgi:hypothetical protein